MAGIDSLTAAAWTVGTALVQWLLTRPGLLPFRVAQAVRSTKTSAGASPVRALRMRTRGDQQLVRVGDALGTAQTLGQQLPALGDHGLVPPGPILHREQHNVPFGIDPGRVVITVDQHANTSAASVPLALDTAVRDGRIKKDDLVVLEAMKMEQPLTAHKSGTVSGLSVSPGDTVSAGAVLATIS